MRCALFCIKKLNAYFNFDCEVLLARLNNCIQDGGVSVYDFITHAEACGLHLQAYRSFFLMNHFPSVILLRPRRCGHYIVLLKRTRFYVFIYDPVYGEKKLHILRLYLVYSKISIVCYNEVEKGEHYEN